MSLLLVTSFIICIIVEANSNLYDNNTQQNNDLVKGEECFLHPTDCHWLGYFEISGTFQQLQLVARDFRNFEVTAVYTGRFDRNPSIPSSPRKEGEIECSRPIEMFIGKHHVVEIQATPAGRSLTVDFKENGIIRCRFISFTQPQTYPLVEGNGHWDGPNYPSNIDNDNIPEWEVSSSILPYKVSSMACGYDPESRKIYIYYGRNDINDSGTINHVASFDPVTSEIATYPDLDPSIGVDFGSQSYSGSPYWYFLARNKFGQFHPNNQTVTYPLKWKNNILPQPQSGNPEKDCMVVTKDGRYIIVLGGDRAPDYRNLVKMHIYDSQNGEWKEGPTLYGYRGGLSCIIDRDNYLWVFGGGVDPVVPAFADKIDISNMDNIGRWKFTERLPRKNMNMRTVLYDDNIYIIGGYDGRSAVSHNAILKYDIKGHYPRLSTVGYLAYRNQESCSVVVGDRIFVLGGNDFDFNGVVPEVQYQDQISISPQLS